MAQGDAIPADTQRAVLRPQVLHAWNGGQIAVAPPDADRGAFRSVVADLAIELDIRPPEIQVMEPNGLIAARANRGFPLGQTPFSSQAKQWVVNHPGWLAAQRQWNDSIVRGGC